MYETNNSFSKFVTKQKDEKDKMLSGELYYGMDVQLIDERKRTQLLIKIFNNSAPGEVQQRKYLLKKILNDAEEGIKIEPPFYCDYGFNISIKENVFINYNCVFLDCNKIIIGANTLIGPSVQIYTCKHPLNPELRRKGLESARSVTIGENVWIGGGAIILPGVTVGDNAVIGAGSVVTKNIPANTIAAGNPCKIIKKVNKEK